MTEKLKVFSINGELSAADYLLCMLLALACTASPYYRSSGECRFSLAFWLTAFSFFAVLLLCSGAIRTFLSMSETYPMDNGVICELMGKVLARPHHDFIIAVFIFACWLPSICFLYPGTLINDTWGQLNQFIIYGFTGHYLFDNHPVFDTILMGTAIVPLSVKTGQWHAVIFCYVLIQAIATATVFSYVVNYVYSRLKLGPGAALFTLLYYCILPLYPASVQTVSKDALFSWIYTLYTVLITEFVRTRGQSLKSWKSLLSFTAVLILCCLTKKAGPLVVIPAYLIVWLTLQRKSLRLLLPAVVSILLMILILPVCFAAWNIGPGGKQEPLSMPFQMTARYVREHSDDITEEEYRILDKVLEMDTIVENYNPVSADPVKRYSQRGDDEDYPAYLKVWFRQGLRHPLSYLKAFNCMLAGWFSWEENDPLMNMDWHSQHNPKLIPDWVPTRSFSAATAAAYQEYYHKLYNMPIFRLLLSYGFYTALVPAFAIVTALKKGKRKTGA